MLRSMLIWSASPLFVESANRLSNRQRACLMCARADTTRLQASVGSENVVMSIVGFFLEKLATGSAAKNSAGPLHG